MSNNIIIIFFSSADHRNIEVTLINLNTVVRSMYGSMIEFRGEVKNDINSLREDLNALNDSVSNLSMCLHEHKKHVAGELNDLQDNITHQLEKIQNAVTNIIGPYTCGGAGGWRRVVYLDMTDPCATCPSGWRLTGNSCGRATDGTNTCDSATFPVTGGEYSRICGRIRGYQWGRTDAFYHSRQVATIDGAYVDGVSVTHGTPRKHIWTFAATISSNPFSTRSCPCDSSIRIIVPSFVGKDYFCESGVNDALWDGENCLPSSICCSRCNPPYFIKQLPTSTTDDIEARICLSERKSNEDITVELVEVYVQ